MHASDSVELSSSHSDSLPDSRVSVPPSLCSMCHSHSPTCRTLGMTVPEIAASDPSGSSGSGDADAAMRASMATINDALLHGFASPASSIAARYSCMDLRAAIPQWEQQQQAGADGAGREKDASSSSSAKWVRDPHKRWDADFVHYSIAGYDYIGTLVAKALMQVERPVAADSAASK